MTVGLCQYLYGRISQFQKLLSVFQNSHYVGGSEFLETMEPEGLSFDMDESRARHAGDLSGSDEGQRAAKAKEFADFSKGMTLAIAYSANVGGVVTLTGTSTNAILKSHLDE